MADGKRKNFRLDHLRDKLGDLYEFEAMLGRGAFATVYLVRNLRLDRYEALKVLAEAYDEDTAFTKRFINEAKLVASLDHPNIVKVYDFGEIDGIVWFSMQYVDGPTLRSELKAQVQLSPASVVGLCIPLLDALDFSHARGTIHRDIKPSNVLLDARGNPFLMDFGIAKSTNMALKTMTGRILGTPAYISPEQVQGQAVDGRADIYSLGAAMYEMLTGRPPFEGDDPLQVIVQRLHEDPRPLSIHRSGIDEELESIVMRALAKEAEHRFTSAGAMRQELIDYWAEEGNPDGFVLRATAPKLVQLEEQSTTTNLDLRRAQGADQKTVVMSTADATMASGELRRRSIGWAMAALAAFLLSVVILRFLMTDNATHEAVAEAATTELVTPEDETSEEVTLEDVIPAAATEDEIGKEFSEEAENDLPSGETDTRGPSKTTTAATVVHEPAAAELQKSKTPEAGALRSAVPQPVVRRAVVAPKILHQPPATLPPELTARCAGQAVIVSLKIGETGEVQSSRVLQSKVKACDVVALTAARSYRFDPGKDAEGLPVAASATVNIRFGEVNE